MPVEPSTDPMNQLSMPPTERHSTAPDETGTPEEGDQGFNNRTSPEEFTKPEYAKIEYTVSTPAYVVDDVILAGIVINGDENKPKWYQERRSVLVVLGLVITAAVLITLGATGVFRSPPSELKNIKNITDNVTCREFDQSSPRLPLQFCKNSTCWEQIGFDLRGTKPKEYFGKFPGLAKGGSRFVLSIDVEKDADNDTVLVYDIDDSGSFNQIGRAFRGEHPGDELSGYLSQDGSRIAVTAPSWSKVKDKKDKTGRVRVFELQSGSWVQLGLHMDGENEKDNFGFSAALNRVGNILAVGSAFFNTDGKKKGKVQVFRLHLNLTSSGNRTGTENNAYWKPLGDPIIPSDVDFDEKSGWSVALSDDGMIVAIGAKNDDVSGKSTGRIRVLRYLNSSWTQMGNDLDGERIDDEYGRFVAISADGKTVAGTALYHDGDDGDGGTKKKSGQIRVYHYNDTTWLPLGRDLYGDNAGDKLRKVSLSASGDRLAMFTGNQPGYIRVYDLVDGDWQQVGGRLTGRSYDSNFGANAALSAGGDRLIVASPSHSGDPCYGGLIRVFRLTV